MNAGRLSASAHPSTRGWSKQKSVTKKEMRGYHAGDDFSQIRRTGDLRPGKNELGADYHPHPDRVCRADDLLPGGQSRSTDVGHQREYFAVHRRDFVQHADGQLCPPAAYGLGAAVALLPHHGRLCAADAWHHPECNRRVHVAGQSPHEARSRQTAADRLGADAWRHRNAGVPEQHPSGAGKGGTPEADDADRRNRLLGGAGGAAARIQHCEHGHYSQGHGRKDGNGGEVPPVPDVPACSDSDGHLLLPAAVRLALCVL